MKKLDLLEKRIKQKAINRFNQEFHKVINLIQQNNILKELTIDDGSKLGLRLAYVPCKCNYKTDLFISSNKLESLIIGEKTNIIKIKEKLVKKYEEEEADNLLYNIKILNDYINKGTEEK